MGSPAEERGVRIRNARTVRGLTLVKLGELAKVSASYLSKLERGTMKSPHPDILRRLAVALDEPRIAAISDGDQQGIRVVFVLMPFDPEFDAVYRDLIQRTLVDAGFRVLRADDLLANANVLRAIIMGIRDSDMVVADLTGLNPNVLYEVGIAHALEKPVILLAQDIEEVPFDLRQYRVVVYSRDFSAAPRLAATLADTARAIAKGEAAYSGPYADIKASVPSATPGGEATIAAASDSMKTTVSDDADAGILDLAEEIQQAIEASTPIVETVGRIMRRFADISNAVASELQSDGPSPPDEFDFNRVRKILRRAASDFSSSTRELRSARMDYERLWTPSENKLGLLLEEIARADAFSGDELAKSQEALTAASNAVAGAKEACEELAEKIASLPRLERRLNKSLSALHSEVLRLSAAFDGTVRFFRRGLDVLSARATTVAADGAN